jgi:hypothetical protein
MSIIGDTGFANDTVTVSVEIENTDEFVGFQFDLLLPDQARYVDGSAELSSRASDHQLVDNLYGTDSLTVFSYSLSNTKFTGSSGAVVSFKAVLGTVPGTYALTLLNTALSDSNSTNILDGTISGSFTIQAPDIDLSPISIDYGRVPLLETADRSFTIQNTGNTDLSVSSITSDLADLEVLGSTNFTLSAGQSQSVTVRFHSNTKGSYEQYVTVASDDPDEPSVSVELSVIAYAVNELDINNVFGRSGHVSTLSIDISNMEDFVAFSFDLDIPESMTLVEGSAELTDRKTDHAVSATTLENGDIRVVAYSTGNETFTGTSGDVLTIDFLIDGLGGFYSINFTDPVIGDAEGNNIISDDYGGILEIAAPDIDVSPGSFTFGDVSIYDTLTLEPTFSNVGSDTLTITQMIFYDPHFFSDQALPLVIDPGGHVTVPVSFHKDTKDDVTSTLRLRSNDPDEDPLDIALSATSFIPNIMRIDSSEIVRNDTGWVHISIENHEEIVGFQCDLHFPEGFTYLDEAILSDRAGDHALTVTEKNGNIISLFSYSMSQDTFDGEDGDVVSMKFLAPALMDDYVFSLSEVIIANSASENVVSSYEDGMIEVISSGPEIKDFPDIVFKEDSDTLFNISGLVSDPNSDYGDLEWTFPEISSLTFNVTGEDLSIVSEQDWNGDITAKVIVSDGELSDSTEFDVTVTPVNDAPVAMAGSEEIDEETVLEFALDATDIDNVNLNFSILVDPLHGTLTGTAPDLAYTPDVDYNGFDSLKFIVDDGDLSDTATVVIEILAVNDRPIATSASVETEEDVSCSITLTGSDPDGDDCTFAVIIEPTRGMLTGTVPNMTYIPEAHYNGRDSLEFTITDICGAKDTGIITIIIDPVNDAPVAMADSVQTPEETSLEIILRASDIDSETLNFIVIDRPTRGTLEGDAPYLTYIPDVAFNGFDSLRFKVSDGEDSDTASILIEVTGVNDPPQAYSQAIETKEDTSKSILLSGYDEDEDELIFTVLDSTLHGVLAGTSPALTYTPDPDYAGQDSLRFVVSDSFASDTGLVNIEVLAVNDAPQALVAFYELPEDSSLIFILTARDVDNDTGDLTFTVLDSTLNGILIGSLPELLYKPYENYTGSDSLHFIVDDGEYSDTSVINFSILPVNDPPVWTALPDTSFNEDDSLQIHLSNVLAYLRDADNPMEDMILSYNVPDNFHYGSIDSILYLTADENWYGEGNITIWASDGNDSAEVMWHITVLPVNDPPVFTAFVDSTLHFEADKRDTTRFSELFTDIDTPDSLVTVMVESIDQIKHEVHRSEGLLIFYTTENMNISDAVRITLDDGDNVISANLIIEITEVAIELIPDEFALHAPYPNPFNPIVTIPFDIPDISDVSVVIYDINGKCVKTLLNGTLEANAYRLTWNGTDQRGKPVSSGIYICRMTAGTDGTKYINYRKMLFVK